MCGAVDILTVLLLSSTWQNFDKQRETALKCDAKSSTYLSLYIYISHPLDNRYGFSLSIGNTKNVCLSMCEGSLSVTKVHYSKCNNFKAVGIG